MRELMGAVWRADGVIGIGIGTFDWRLWRASAMTFYASYFLKSSIVSTLY